MGKSYNYSRTRGDETFAVEGFDSFFEAVKAVEKGIDQYDKLMKKENEKVPAQPKAEEPEAEKAEGDVDKSPEGEGLAAEVDKGPEKDPSEMKNEDFKG